MKLHSLLFASCLGVAVSAWAQSNVTTPGGTVGEIPMFNTSTSIENSGVTSDGAGNVKSATVTAKNIVINPIQYGALCNGGDDSAAVQSALSAAIAGSIVEFTCMASVGNPGWTGLTIPISDITIRGAHGGGLTALVAPSQTILGGLAPNILLLVNGQSHVVIDGLEINGGGINTGLIGLQACTYCTVSHDFLHNSAGSGSPSANGISAVNGSFNNFVANTIIGTGRGGWIGNAVSGEQEDHDLISENVITNCNATGIAYNGSHGRIVSNESSYNAGSGIALSSGTGAIQAETQVANNILRYNLFQGVQSDTTGGNSNSPRNISIVGNDIAYNTDAGIYAPNSLNWTMANNNIIDNSQGGGYAGIVIGQNAQNVVATGNVLGDDQSTHTQTIAISISAQALNSLINNITISHNISSYGAGIQVFQGSATTPGSGISIIGNTITGAPGYGIQIDPAYTNIVLSSNNVSGSGTADIRNDGSSSNTIGSSNSYSTSSGFVPYPTTAGGLSGTPNVAVNNVQFNTCSSVIGAQSGYLCYLYWNNAALNGFWIGPNVAPNSGIFPFGVTMGGGVPAFYVKGIGSSQVEVAVNNGQILNGYSGNQVTNTWYLKASDGSTSFASGKSTIDSNGVRHENGSAPSVSAGTVTGTNAGGYISGLSTATSVTLTFANSGWGTWASCVANTSVSATQPYITSISKTAVMFTFPSLTGTLYYQCSGN